MGYLFLLLFLSATASMCAERTPEQNLRPRPAEDGGRKAAKVTNPQMRLPRIARKVDRWLSEETRGARSNLPEDDSRGVRRLHS